ncbi:undecaprenyl-phosphate galactose phosphotransferase WbaP [Thorsellia anophelis]|uniref:Undecaprenyl-phosphate galactose phosphotransferase n=1 Tax=Thorsellia anophelis DSM 18579 TaxID=1123402 RepID=A0A1I0G036_9GAMM|nr:undecaprenyl-phosphate galactose phosphotransferase WbaP [Thorsellia anophelis]SET63181.1 undecaprenyl-phosphate galactose phosphotransferase [Thorsellia anophelis DSM 18579]
MKLLFLSRERKMRLGLMLGDIITYNLALLLAYKLLYFFSPNVDNHLPDHLFEKRFIVQFVLSGLLCGWFLSRLRHYSYRKPFWLELKEILRTLIIFAVLDLAIVAFSKWGFSRTLWVLTFTAIFIILPLMRFSIKMFFIKTGIWQKSTVLVGAGKNALDVYSAIGSEKFLGYQVNHFIQVDGLDNLSKVFPDSYVKKSTIENFFAMKFISDTVFIIALESGQEKTQQQVINHLSNKQHRNVHIVPDIRGIPLYGTDMSFIFSHEVILFRLNNNLAKRTSRFFKRAFDLSCATALVMLLSPLLLWIYLSIKKDDGKVIYAHERIGRNGKPFNCLKFRSMVTNSQEILNDLLENDPASREEWERDFKLKNDPRITKIGAFLRKTSLDELPQLFNVIKGEMSLVGPRPIIEEELLRYRDSVNYYLMAKPGMTGLWQVSGRNDIDYERRVYFDVWYVKNWSLWNDIAILFKTINVVLNRTGAY